MESLDTSWPDSKECRRSGSEMRNVDEYDRLEHDSIAHTDRRTALCDISAIIVVFSQWQRKQEVSDRPITDMDLEVGRSPPTFPI